MNVPVALLHTSVCWSVCVGGRDGGKEGAHHIVMNLYKFLVNMINLENAFNSISYCNVKKMSRSVLLGLKPHIAAEWF